MTQNHAADFEPLISRELAGNTIDAALRLFVGRGRRYSVGQLASATGVKERVIESAMGKGSEYRPLPIEAMLSITLFLGSRFTNEVLRIARQGAYDLPDDRDPDLSRVAAESVEDAATISRMAVDGFQRGNAASLAAVGTHKIERGMQLVAYARRAA